MFTTFAGTPQSIPRRDRVAKEVDASSTPRPPDPPSKPKRHQVSRACDSCRMHRVKCDNNVPCRNCLNRGEQCINKSPSERRTLPQAYREIERLKQQVEELETQLETERASSKPATASFLAQSSSILTPPSTSELSPAGDGSLSRNREAPQRAWEGVYANTGQSSQKTWYGPSSQFYFVSRMNTYLAALFQQMYPDNYIQLKLGAKSFTAPDYNLAEAEHKLSKEPAPQLPTEEYLKPTQEEYFLDLFWQSIHTAAVILNEAEFKDHYRSLLTKPGEPRKPSALVDVVIALSMQIGTAIVPKGLSRASQKSDVDENDSTIAGGLYYRRCQRLLVTEQESPAISTLQCQILSAIYLCSASFHNMSQSMLAMAVRTAHMLGLHHEPADDVSLATREMQKRLWWFLYTLEGKACMKLGRPFYTDLSLTSSTLLADNHVVANLAGSNFLPVDEHTTWLTYSLENTRLVSAAREVHMAFYNKYPEIYTGGKGQRGIYNDPPALERYAEFLSSIIQSLHGWTQSVPKALITKRRGEGKTLSTDCSPLEMEQFAPLWLQRQRLLLELLYHNLAMNIYRPFILFPSTSEICPPPALSTLTHATSCVEHAMALTHIMHQIFSETDILVGWHESFQWQWNCALTLVGYLFAHPNTSIASSVRQAVDLALTVFDIFGRSIAAANSAAVVVRDLAAKADYLEEMTRASDFQAQAVQNIPADPESSQLADGNAIIPFTENDISTMQNTLNGSMFSVDFYNNLDMLWPPPGSFLDDRQYDFGQGMGSYGS